MKNEYEQEFVVRDGIPIEKGVVLTKEFLDSNQELFTSYLNYWILYPDLFNKKAAWW